MPSKKQDEQEAQDDTYIDQELGLVLRKDPFGGEAHDIVDLFKPEEWEILEEDFGPVIDWPTSPKVAGKLVNQKTVNIDHGDDRGEQPTNLYSLIDAMDGERKAFYGNYQLDQALGCNAAEGGKSPYLGRLILVMWHGKRDQGKGGRTLNVFTVAAKRASIAEEEAAE